MATRWSKEEVEYLKNNYGKGEIATRIIADTLGRDESCIRAKASHLGIKCEKRMVYKPPCITLVKGDEHIQKRGYKVQKKRKIAVYTYEGDDKAVCWQICHDIINMIRYKAGMELSTAVSPYNNEVQRIVEYVYK